VTVRALSLARSGALQQPAQMGRICSKTMHSEDLPETSELLTFARVVETRSISRAARELGVPRPTVGRRLARLEERLGVRLIKRTTRTMALTDAGEQLYRRARAVLEAVRDASRSVQREDGAVRGLLRASIPPMQGMAFGAFIAEFSERYPDVRVELEASSRYVDLVAGGFDVAIRASTELAPGLIARPLAKSRLYAVAAPSYLQGAPAIKRSSDLAKHQCLSGFDRGEHPATHWPLLNGGRVAIEPRLVSNDLMILRDAMLSGLGIALLPEPSVRDDLAEGRCACVLPNAVGATATIAVVYADRELVPPAVRAFIDAVVRWFEQSPIVRSAASGGLTARAARG
jgi:DNA-binding transcriptional LysR family regulator